MNHIAHFADFSDATRIHDNDAICGLSNDAHIMGDQHHCRTLLATHFFKEFNDLCLYRYIQRSRGFVRNNQLGLRRQG